MLVQLLQRLLLPHLRILGAQRSQALVVLPPHTLRLPRREQSLQLVHQLSRLGAGLAPDGVLTGVVSERAVGVEVEHGGAADDDGVGFGTRVAEDARDVGAA